MARRLARAFFRQRLPREGAARTCTATRLAVPCGDHAILPTLGRDDAHPTRRRPRATNTNPRSASGHRAPVGDPQPTISMPSRASDRYSNRAGPDAANAPRRKHQALYVGQRSMPPRYRARVPRARHAWSRGSFPPRCMARATTSSRERIAAFAVNARNVISASAARERGASNAVRSSTARG